MHPGTTERTGVSLKRLHLFLLKIRRSNPDAQSMFQGPWHVRFAPSPTGFLHLGGLRTALFNFLAARGSGGTLTLRIEDTDQSRTVAGATEDILRSLKWAGLRFDRGLDANVVDPSYVQSNRKAIYQEHIGILLEMDQAYRCDCTIERLTELRQRSHGYDRHCRSRRVPDTAPHVVRLKSKCASVTFIEHSEQHTVLHSDDVVLMKSDGMPTYHLANVVDDHLMGVNLVMRGQEWLSSTPLHAALYDAFRWEKPFFAHLPLLVRPDGRKLSKRDRDAPVSYYIESGYEPSALINFLATLGWTKPIDVDEILNLEQLNKLFRLEELNRASAMVDNEKLLWFNRQHIARSFFDLSLLPGDDTELKRRALSLVLHRLDFKSQLLERFRYLFEDPVHYEEDNQNPSELESLLECAQNSNSYEELFKLASDSGVIKSVNTLLRHCLTGCRIGVPLRDLYGLLGKEGVIRRIRKALLTATRDVDGRLFGVRLHGAAL